jgi:hypothetical protein
MSKKLYGQDPSNVEITGGNISGVTISDVDQDHNDLNEIQGGDSTSNEHYHLTFDEHTASSAVMYKTSFNQLLNTSFERWTNSGLTQGLGSGRQTDFNVTNIFTDTDGSSAASWVGTNCNITDGGAYLLITQTGGTTQYAKYTLAGLTVGKRYKLVATITNGTGSLGWGDKIRVEQNGGTIIRSSRTETSGSTYSILWQAVGTTDKIGFVLTLGAGQTIQVSNVYVDECHHGCVAADSYAADTHSKTTTLDCFREWNEDVSSSYGKGRYLLKLVKGADGAEYYNFDEIANDGRDGLGKHVVFGCYVYALQDNNIKLSAYDGSTEFVVSDTYCPANELTWMEITGVVPETATVMKARILCDGATGDVAYISEPIAMLGTYIGPGNYRVGHDLNLPACQLNSTENQTIASTSIDYPVTFNNEDVKQALVHSTSVESSKVKMTSAGTYLITFSAIADLTGTTAKRLSIWLAVDGENVANSNTVCQLPNASTETLVVVSFINTFTENQYFELIMHGDDTGLRLVTTAATSGPPPRPASPSIILTVNKIAD